MRANRGSGPPTNSPSPPNQPDRPNRKPIPLLTPNDLTPFIVEGHLYPNLEQTLFWSPIWDADFYIALAEAGFISISTEHPERGPLLIPELQARYAVLDWENLHCSRHLGKLLRSRRLEELEMELRIVDDPARVLDRVLAYHHRRTWLTRPYRELLRRLPNRDAPTFTLHGVELWSREKDQLVSGELGYTIGRTYTSLSGFHTPDTAESHEWRHFGTLQMWRLAERLRDRGFAFWNMGHTSQIYKRRLGARVLPRPVFLERWLEARGETPRRSLR